ncbi:MAG: carbohydrate ABC transporter permease [Halanaerobiaceae bacterium]|nr:carbohydrate ABC transporter permease [Halanaerobiaceae bacterium]
METNIDINVKHRFTKTVGRQAADILDKISQEKDQNRIGRANKKIKGILISLIRAVFLIGVSYIILMPLLEKLATSFMTEADIFDQTVRWIPRNFTLENYKVTLQAMNYPVSFLNTLILTLTVSILQLASCTTVAYGIGRFKFPGNRLVFALAIFTLVVPPTMIVVPLSLNFKYFTFFGLLPEPGISLLNSYWPFILISSTAVGLRNGLFIYVMRQFFKGMPKDLEEAAYVDGAGIFKTFYKIMLPGAIPGLVVIFLFSFVWQWNDYFYNTIFLSGQGNFLLQALQGAALKALDGDHNKLKSQYASIIRHTGMILYIAPLLILYAIMQRYFIESIQRTGIVG